MQQLTSELPFGSSRQTLTEQRRGWLVSQHIAGASLHGKEVHGDLQKVNLLIPPV